MLRRMSQHPVREADLYLPLKTYLEAQGYEVKAEIGDCDLMARRGDEDPVIIEMKLTFSLALVMQGVARQALFDQVYLAVPASSERGWKLRYKDITRLCRRLGLGLLAVKFAKRGPVVEAHLDPAPYAPRKNAQRRGRLLKEFERRVGDPNEGGIGGIKKVTSYRQDAIRLARCLSADGPAAPAALKTATGIDRARAILSDDHYGWFERISRGVYGLTPKGAAELPQWQDAIPES